MIPSNKANQDFYGTLQRKRCEEGIRSDAFAEVQKALPEAKPKDIRDFLNTLTVRTYNPDDAEMENNHDSNQ